MNYYVTKTYPQSNFYVLRITKDLLDFFEPPTHISSDFKNWVAELDIKTCFYCRKLHGKIFYFDEISEVEPPVHKGCRCVIKEMKAAFIGTATQDGENGTDVYLSTTGNLPDCYITKKASSKCRMGKFSWKLKFCSTW